MNIVLFEPSEVSLPLPLSDPRGQHVRKVLRREVGENFDVGLINGPRGKATIKAIIADAYSLEFLWSPPHPAPISTTVIVGLPRPQTARDILRDATTMGATTLHFVHTARTDPNYSSSSLWTRGEWHRQIRLGAAQAFVTHLPDVTWTQSLTEAIALSRASTEIAFALDNYEASAPLAQLDLPSAYTPATVMIGPERGWDSVDRALFSDYHIPLYGLGDRVLRTETAATVALALINAARARA
jgi:16S rRNA (uracil1498-N3)-methyltransferase